MRRLLVTVAEPIRWGSPGTDVNRSLEVNTRRLAVDPLRSLAVPQWPTAMQRFLPVTDSVGTSASERVAVTHGEGVA